MKVLLVYDDATMRKVAANILKADSYKIFMAQEGALVLQILRRERIRRVTAVLTPVYLFT